MRHAASRDLLKMPGNAITRSPTETKQVAVSVVVQRFLRQEIVDLL